MKIWYCHGQYKASGLGTNKVSYNIFDLRHVSKSTFVHLFKYPNEESGKNIKKRGCRAVFRTLPNVYNGAFLHQRCLIRF